jgi:galactoside O-acetyltransferase
MDLHYTNRGLDVRISERAVLKNPDLITLGSHVAIDDYVVITTQADIGDYVHIANQVSIIGGRDAKVTLGHFSGIAPGVRIVCAGDDFTGDCLHNPTVQERFRCVVNKPVEIGPMVTIGANTVILPGVKIGIGSTVGAGSVVTKDVLPWSVYVGTPASKIKDRPHGKMLLYAKELGHDFTRQEWIVEKDFGMYYPNLCMSCICTYTQLVSDYCTLEQLGTMKETCPHCEQILIMRIKETGGEPESIRFNGP